MLLSSTVTDMCISGTGNHWRWIVIQWHKFDTMIAFASHLEILLPVMSQSRLQPQTRKMLLQGMYMYIRY